MVAMLTSEYEKGCGTLSTVEEEHTSNRQTGASSFRSSLTSVFTNKNALSSLQILDHRPDSSFLSLADVIGPSTNAGIRSVDST